MTERQSETLSALMDGELNAVQEQRYLDLLVNNEAERTRWHHYHLIGASLRGETKVGLPLDISAAVAAQIAQEPAHFVAKHKRLNSIALQRWFKPAANVAIAASVALVTVLGVSHYQRIDDGTLIENEHLVRGYQSALQTVPLGVVGNPLSYNAQQSQADTQEPLTTKEQIRLQYQIQAFMLNHQLQLQQQLVVEEENKPEEQEQPPY